MISIRIRLTNRYCLFAYQFIKNINDQGPYGGHRALYWKCNDDNTFSSDTIIKFASENGWILIDSSEYQENQTTNWTYFGKPIFPLDHSGFSDAISNNSTFEYFPRWFGGRLKYINSKRDG